MSGVYIAGMQKPEKCDECPLQTADMICELSTCPLIPVPDHGELIDREKLCEQTANWEAQALDQVLKHGPVENKDRWILWSAVRTERSAFKFAVKDAPTIIPADKKDPEP